MTHAIHLGVNIDHVATLRQVRRTAYPDVLEAAMLAVRGGADSITVHLREDRRHIQPADVLVLNQTLTVPLNLEMANTPDMVAFAMQVKPAYVCIVPERREELTTEGGLDVFNHQGALAKTCQTLVDRGIRVSLFIDPISEQVHAAASCGASAIELHTGAYADAKDATHAKAQLFALFEAGKLAAEKGMQVHAGHGLTQHNLLPLLALPHLSEVNIGHSIVARALVVGMTQAVFEIKSVLTQSHDLSAGIE